MQYMTLQSPLTCVFLPQRILLLGIDISSWKPKELIFGWTCCRAVFHNLARKSLPLNLFAVTYDAVIQWWHNFSEFCRLVWTVSCSEQIILRSRQLPRSSLFHPLYILRPLVTPHHSAIPRSFLIQYQLETHSNVFLYFVSACLAITHHVFNIFSIKYSVLISTTI